MWNRKKLAQLVPLFTCLLALSGCANAAREPAPPEIPENASSHETASEVGTMPSGQTPSADPSADSPESAPTETPSSEITDTPVTVHGALHVANGQLADQNDLPVQLCGMSTHGIAWYPQYVNYDAFQTLRDDWNTSCVRLAMYTAESGGYCTDGNREELKALVQDGVECATRLGMYVIIDWHILSDQDPNVYRQDALDFFEEMSRLYADYDNVLYEICNEPNGSATWDSVKSYAEEVIPVIRQNDGDAVILVGSPTWSQDIDKAAADPLPFDNILYTLHFYAGTHRDDLRNRLETCVQSGLPVFVSEFGMCDASGNGANDFDSAAKWLELLDRYHISYLCWNLADKEESSSVLLPGNGKVSGWTEEDLSEAGSWIRERFRSRPKAE